MNTLNTLSNLEYLGKLAAVATAILWTASTLAWTAAGKHVGALAVCTVRLILTCVMLAVYGQILCGQCLPLGVGLTTWLILGLSGIMGFLVSDLCVFKAYLLIGPRVAMLIMSLVPLMTAIISWLTLGDQLSLLQILGILVTLAGVAWVVFEQPHGNERHPQWRYGIFLSILAAAAQAAGLVLSKCGIGDCDAGAATMIRVLPALAGFLVIIAISHRWPIILTTLRSPRVMTILTAGSVVGPFLGVILSLVALRYCPAGVVATILATMPVLILPASIFFYHEKVSFRAFMGAILSVVGVALLVL